MKILIVEDNLDLQNAIANTLESENFLCEKAEAFIPADEKIRLYNYDILVVDINLPGGSGLELIRTIKEINPQTGIIVVSARDSLDHKIQGLEFGADDYITKPFDMAELVARVKSLLRRKNFGGSNVIDFGNISVDTARREVMVRNSKIELTKSEFEILLFFLSNPGRVITRESLAEHIWGDNMDLADSFDFIYSHIKNLRKKVKSSGGSLPINTVYGLGYKLDISEIP